MHSSQLQKALRQLDHLELPPEDEWVSTTPAGARGKLSAVTFIAIVALASVAAIVLLRAVREPIDRSPVPGAVPTAAATSRPDSALHTVTGTVFETTAGTRRPAQNVYVNIWVQGINSGYSVWYALGHPITTDANGRFAASNLGDSFLVLTAVDSGYVQPRAVTVSLRSDTVLDIELLEAASASTLTSPSPADSPTLSGIVYETTPDGRRPVPGATVTAEWIDLLVANTTTDPAGRFWLGRIAGENGRISVFASKAGYSLSETLVQISRDDVVVDIELKPSP